MHCAIRLIAFLLFIFCTSWGCGGSPNLLKEIPTTVNTVKAAKGHKKQVALALTKVPNSPLGKTVGDHYLKVLGDTVRNESGRLNLLTPQDSEFPGFLAEYPGAPSSALDAGALSLQGRQAGYQGLIAAGINDIRAIAKKTGIFWMRKTRHFIHYTITVDLYDPYSAAKIVSEVVEDTIKISAEDYDRIQAGTASSLGRLDAAVEGVAQEHGELIAQALDDHQWKSTVIKVQNGRIFMPSTPNSGLRKGDRLSVFEGRRLLESKHGEAFIATGVQVGEIEIITETGPHIEAKVLNLGKIKEGDIVIPVR